MSASSGLFQFRYNRLEQIRIQSTTLLLLLACTYININQIKSERWKSCTVSTTETKGMAPRTTHFGWVSGLHRDYSPCRRAQCPLSPARQDSSLPRNPEDFKHVFGSSIRCLNDPENRRKAYTRGARPFGACTKSGREIQRLFQTLARATRGFSLHLLLHKFAEDKNPTSCFPASSAPVLLQEGEFLGLQRSFRRTEGWPWTLPRTQRAAQRPQATKTCDDPKIRTTPKYVISQALKWSAEALVLVLMRALPYESNLSESVRGSWRGG